MFVYFLACLFTCLLFDIPFVSFCSIALEAITTNSSSWNKKCSFVRFSVRQCPRLGGGGGYSHIWAIKVCAWE